MRIHGAASLGGIWRLTLAGVATAGGALIEEYVWFRMLLVILAGAGLYFGAKPTGRLRGEAIVGS